MCQGAQREIMAPPHFGHQGYGPVEYKETSMSEPGERSTAGPRTVLVRLFRFMSYGTIVIVGPVF